MLLILLQYTQCFVCFCLFYFGFADMLTFFKVILLFDTQSNIVIFFCNKISTTNWFTSKCVFQCFIFTCFINRSYLWKETVYFIVSLFLVYFLCLSYMSLSLRCIYGDCSWVFATGYCRENINYFYKKMKVPQRIGSMLNHPSPDE